MEDEERKDKPVSNRQDEAAVKRHKRRIRTEVVSYITLVVLIVVIAGLAVLGVRRVMAYLKDRPVPPVDTVSSEVPDSESAEMSEPQSSEAVEQPVSSVESIEASIEADPEPSPEELFEAQLTDVIAGMSLEDKVMGLFFVTPEAITKVGKATRAGDATRKALEANPVGGIMYGQSNYTSEAQFTEMIGNTLQMCQNPTFIGYRDDDAASRLQAAGVSDSLLIDYKSLNTGSVAADQVDMESAVLVAGTQPEPAIGDDVTPCCFLENAITGKLRTELGYTGVVITAPLNVKAITDYYTSGQAAVLALRAGCDMICMPEDFRAAYDAVIAAVSEGTVSEQRIDDALKRIFWIKLQV